MHLSQCYPGASSSYPGGHPSDYPSGYSGSGKCRAFLLLQIYLRVPLHAREDLAEWRSILQNIMESSATATRLVLVTLAHSDAHRRQPLLEETILINSVCFLLMTRTAARHLFAVFLLQMLALVWGLVRTCDRLTCTCPLHLQLTSPQQMP